MHGDTGDIERGVGRRRREGRDAPHPRQSRRRISGQAVCVGGGQHYLPPAELRATASAPQARRPGEPGAVETADWTSTTSDSSPTHCTGVG